MVGVMLDAPKGNQMMESVTKNKSGSLSAETPAAHSLMYFVTNSPMLGFPTSRKMQSMSSEDLWGNSTKRCSKALQSVDLLPDSDDEELPWHDEQQEELK